MDHNNQVAANANAAPNQGPAPDAQPPQNEPAPARAAQAPAKPKRQRNKTFHNPAPISTDAHGMLEAIERLSMCTKPTQPANRFVPDASMLFHTLGICDELINTNEHFLNSSPAWLPIVSQLYTSVLWLYQILRVYVSSGHGFHYARIVDDLDHHLRIQECPVPGPLVPFFQSLAAVDGYYEWIGDIVPFLPDVSDFWDAEFHPQPQFARSVPIPAIILDQLHRFSRWEVPAGQTLYDDFLWYSDIFGEELEYQGRLARIGPQLIASLHTTEDQLNAAHKHWHDALSQGIRLTNAEGLPFDNILQIFGFMAQNERHQIDWFQQVSTAMQLYCRHFTGSLPLKSIQPTGLGSVLVTGTPANDDVTRDWLYPAVDTLDPFPTSQIEANRAIPEGLTFSFVHSDPTLEAQVEQLGMLTHSNILWGNQPLTQNGWTQLNNNRTHLGDYWRVPYFRYNTSIVVAPHLATEITEESYLPEEP